MMGCLKKKALPAIPSHHSGKIVAHQSRIGMWKYEKIKQISIRVSPLCVFIFFCLTKSPKEVRLLGHVEGKNKFEGPIFSLDAHQFLYFLRPSGMK